MIYRIFTEKKRGFDVEASAQREELSAQLELSGLTGLRIINRYDVNLIGDTDFKPFVYGVFAEINQDEVYFDELPKVSDAKIFAVRYQSGQYDARSDAAAQCMKLIKPDVRTSVRHMKIFVLTGEVSDAELARIQEYLINPVDSELVEYDSQVSFETDARTPSTRVVQEGFTKLSDDELSSYISKNSLAMDVEDCKAVRDYFCNVEKREPTLTEIKVLDTYWSDHCRHTTFSTIIDDIGFGEGKINDEIKAEYFSYLKEKTALGREHKPTTLMDLATIGTRIVKSRGLGGDIEESDEINACSYFADVTIDGKPIPYLVMFKNETHNHPTEIEPFGGAATCLGGAIRDPLAGRSYVYQSMRVTGCADPRLPVSETMRGKLPQRKITTQAAAGFSSYGNQIGLCTGQVREYYHPRFVAKRMEVGAVIGAAPAENVVRKAPEAGDIIYVIGGRTGRDGIGGASGSSKAHTEKSVDTAGSEVQKGNAPQERKLQRLFRRGEFSRLIKKCNDFGAGGVSVAIGELADSLEIDLDTVLLKYEGLNATELAISESQERMAVLIAPESEAEFLRYVREENLEYSKTAIVTDTGRLIMHYRGEEVLNLSRAFIDTNGTSKHTSVYVDMSEKTDYIHFSGSFAQRMQMLAENLNTTSQKGLTERFDNTIGAGSVLMPYGGKNALTPSDVMAAKIPTLVGECATASMMAHGYDPYLACENPYLGAYEATLSAVNKLVCAGAKYQNIRMSAQEYFGKLGTDANKWGEVFAALLGTLKLQKTLGIPAIGGKDSMSGTYEDIDVPPTLIAFGAVVCEIKDVLTNVMQCAGSPVAVIIPKRNVSGAVDAESFRMAMDALEAAIGEGLVRSACAVGFGGIAEAAAKLCLGNGFGFDYQTTLSLDELFAADYSASVVELTDEAALSKLGALLKDQLVYLGRSNDEAIIRFGGEAVALSEYVKAWEAPLSGVFPIFVDEQNEAAPVSDYSKTTLIRQSRIARPRVFIPVFPGTNCEYDSARAFEREGACADVFVFKNNTPADILESAKEMAARIDKAQMIMFPGGFSAADEPDGSGKFIVSVLRNPYITEAVMKLIKSRDGLILGICNGFQALIKTGLLPYGEITDLSESAPTLTYNSIGRHVAKLVHTRIASTRSPWLSGVSVGDVQTVAISHGEGRFAASKAEIKRLIENKQIALQYCDREGNVEGNGKINPNLSAYNIEGIISPDGRILGKMGHSERSGAGLYKNAPGNFESNIFSAGVKYYD